MLPKGVLALLLLGLVCPMGHPADAFMVDDCTIGSNIVVPDEEDHDC